jgi:imidazolonepropionase-like amidohydrolase
MAMRRLASTYVLILAALPRAQASPEIPGKPQTSPIALVGGTIHPLSGPDLPGGTLVFEGGKISSLGAEVKLPEGCQTIDVTGKHVYPGLFESFTDLGLIEIPAVRATVDKAESGSINPNVRANVAVNPDSELIPVARAAGVLTMLTVPSGGVISGQSAVMYLDGWTTEEMTVKSPAGLHVAWPRVRPLRAWWLKAVEDRLSAEREKNIRAISEAFASARAYQRKKAAGEAAYDARWEAMLPALEGRIPVVVHADECEQIQAAVAFAVRENLRLVLVGGYGAADCAELLKRHDIPVIIAGVQRLPERPSDFYDEPFTLASRLHEAGVRFCISGAVEASNVRNLPYHAGMAAAFGLPKEEALRAITLYPARIMGVEDRLGSLEPGKDATLIVTDGDPLETPTHVLRAYIQGRQVDLSNRHLRLWEKYKEKYRRLGLDNNGSKVAPPR